MLFLNILLLIVGFAALVKGADFFVDGSSALARTFKVPGVIIGLTIVALGTSAPELAVSTSAAIQGANEIALSNVVGSNIFNLLMVLGVCAIIRPIPIEKAILKRDFPLSIIVTAALFGVLAIPLFTGKAQWTAPVSTVVSEVSRPIGIGLLVIFAAYMAFLIYVSRKNPTEDDLAENMPVWNSLLLILIGLACIVIGGQLVVENAKSIAAAFGMSETLIGLTVVALGTSLPELVTSIVAARKGEHGMAVGNVVGSNIFNLMFILGISSTIHPVAVNLASVTDLAILVVVSVAAYIFSLTNKISRIEGVLMVLMYIGTMAYAIIR